jgi:hypothetical protein
VTRSTLRLSSFFLAIALAFSLGACDSSDPVDDPIDNPGNGDDGDSGDNGDDGTYSCTIPSLDGIAVGEATVAFDYAVTNADDDATGEYTGAASYGSVEHFSDPYSVIYLPDGDGTTNNVTFYEQTDAPLAAGEYSVELLGSGEYVGYFFIDHGDFQERSGGGGTLEIVSVEDGVAAGTFEFGDSFSAFCGAFRAELNDDLDPVGFDPR